MPSDHSPYDRRSEVEAREGPAEDREARSPQAEEEIPGGAAPASQGAAHALQGVPGGIPPADRETVLTDAGSETATIPAPGALPKGHTDVVAAVIPGAREFLEADLVPSIKRTAKVLRASKLAVR